MDSVLESIMQASASMLQDAGSDKERVKVILTTAAADILEHLGLSEPATNVIDYVRDLKKGLQVGRIRADYVVKAACDELRAQSKKRKADNLSQSTLDIFLRCQKPRCEEPAESPLLSDTSSWDESCPSALPCVEDNIEQLDGEDVGEHYRSNAKSLLLKVRTCLQQGDIHTALALLDSLSSHVGYVGDEFMECLLVTISGHSACCKPMAPASEQTCSEHTKGLTQLLMECPARERESVGARHACVTPSTCANLTSLHGIPEHDLLTSRKCIASNTSAVDPARWKRLLKPTAAGRTPSLQEILGLAARFPEPPARPLYSHVSEVKRLLAQDGFTTIGVLIKPQGLSGSVAIYLKSAKVIIQGKTVEAKAAMESLISRWTDPWPVGGPAAKRIGAAWANIPSPQEARSLQCLG